MKSSEKDLPHTILAVDDSPPILKLVSEALEIQGYKTLLASNAEAALRVFQKNKKGIDLVITDMLMPGMNGLEMVSRMVYQRPDLRVLYMSDSGVLASEFSDKGEVSFLEKPFSMGALTVTVNQLLALGAEKQAANKRKFLRIPVSWTTFFSEETQKIIGEGQIIDLSIGGCSIETNVNIPLETQLTMEICPPVFGLPIQIEAARVQWTTDTRFGVEFIGMQELDRERLRRSVGTLLSQPVDGTDGKQ